VLALRAYCCAAHRRGETLDEDNDDGAPTAGRGQREGKRANWNDKADARKLKYKQPVPLVRRQADGGRRERGVRGQMEAGLGTSFVSGCAAVLSASAHWSRQCHPRLERPGFSR